MRVCVCIRNGNNRMPNKCADKKLHTQTNYWSSIWMCVGVSVYVFVWICMRTCTNEFIQANHVECRLWREMKAQNGNNFGISIPWKRKWLSNYRQQASQFIACRGEFRWQDSARASVWAFERLNSTCCFITALFRCALRNLAAILVNYITIFVFPNHWRINCTNLVVT